MKFEQIHRLAWSLDGINVKFADFNNCTLVMQVYVLVLRKYTLRYVCIKDVLSVICFQKAQITHMYMCGYTCTQTHTERAHVAYVHECGKMLTVVISEFG